MASRVREVERALLALAPEERAAVIHAGILSLDSNDSHTRQGTIDSAWRAEIDNRLEDVLRGRLELGSFEATRKQFISKYPSAVR